MARTIQSYLPKQVRKYATNKNLMIAGGVIVIGAALWFMFGKKLAASTGNDGKIQIPPTGKGTASGVIVNIKPEGAVPSNSYMMVNGYFFGPDNQVMTVPEGYYYVFRDTGLTTGYQFVYAGSLGKNVSDFNINVPTTFFQDGSYEIVVSDEPIPDNILGTGKFANPVYQGGTTFKDASNVVKNALTGYEPGPAFPSPNRVISGEIPPQQFSQDVTFV